MLYFIYHVIESLEANGKRMKYFGPKVAVGHLMGKCDFQKIGKVFLAKVFRAGSQDMGLQLCSLYLSKGRTPSRRFGPPNTEILG